MSSAYISQTLYNHLTIDGGHDNLAVSWLHSTINNKYITGKDARTFHRISTYTYEKCRCGILHYKIVDIECFFNKVVSGRRKPCSRFRGKQWSLYRRSFDRFSNINNTCRRFHHHSIPHSIRQLCNNSASSKCEVQMEQQCHSHHKPNAVRKLHRVLSAHFNEG